MTDRELLELAAKAAGLRGRWPVPDYDMQFTPAGIWCPGMGEGQLWNPLTDDGDALRLAVKLRIDVAHARDYVVSGLGTAGSMRRENGDDCTATRRAIVRAAAEIGRSMP